MTAILIHESEATALVFDLCGFSRLAATLAPIEMAIALSRFYQHAEDCMVQNGGRVVKLMGDALLGCWLEDESRDHRRDAISCIKQARATQASWAQSSISPGLPGPLSYTVAAATGQVLCGELGTARLRGFDVLGAPVVTAAQLTSVAASRGVPDLVTSEVLASPNGTLPAVEVAGTTLGGRTLRLFRVE